MLLLYVLIADFAALKALTSTLLRQPASEVSIESNTALIIVGVISEKSQRFSHSIKTGALLYRRSMPLRFKLNASNL